MLLCHILYSIKGTELWSGHIEILKLLHTCSDTAPWPPHRLKLCQMPLFCHTVCQLGQLVQQCTLTFLTLCQQDWRNISKQSLSVRVFFKSMTKLYIENNLQLWNFIKLHSVCAAPVPAGNSMNTPISCWTDSFCWLKTQLVMASSMWNESRK